MSIKRWFLYNTYSLSGKTVAITGSTGGIGTALCEYLAQLKANLICVDRNTDKSKRLISNLKNRYPDLNVKHIRLDLADINNVKDVAASLSASNIDCLILNAGIYNVPMFRCTTGYNNIFQVNFISQYYLARELCQKIRLRGGRVVAVSSIAYDYSNIDISDVDFSNRKASSKVYGNSKRFLTYALYGYFDDDDTLSVVHPGITFTNITAHYPKLLFKIIKYPMKVIFISPKKAALNIIYGIFNGCNKNEWIGPYIFNIWGFPKKKTLHTCSPKEANIICNVAEKIYGDIKLNAMK